MADELELFDPGNQAAQPIHFPCPACGRDCKLTPKFYTKGSAAGVRHGHGVQHSVPACRTYQTMSPMDFMVLATKEVPILNQDVHVSVKVPDAPPLIIADLNRVPAEKRAELEAQGQEAFETDRRAFDAEAAELGRVRDHLVEREQRELELAARHARRRAVVGLVVAACVVAVLAVVIVWSLRQHG